MSSKPQRILFVLENFYPKIGGVETLFYNLTTELANQGHHVTILTTKAKERPSFEQLLPNLTVRRTWYEDRYLFTIFSFFILLRMARSFDLIHTTSYNAGLPSSWAGFIRRIPVVITFHEYWGRLWFDLPYFTKITSTLHYTFERFLLKMPFTRIVAVSQSTLNNLKKAGVKEDKLSFIYNGLNYDEFGPKPEIEVEKRFVFFGRLGISKGIDILLKGIALVPDLKGYKFHVIISERKSSFLDKIMKLRAKLGLRDVVEFVNTMPWETLKDYVRGSYAVVVPSYSEGFCFVAVESMALGTPVVVSGRGALSEVVGGKHLIFESFDPQGCADALEKAINNQWVVSSNKVYPIEIMIDNYLALYRSIKE